MGPTRSTQDPLVVASEPADRAGLPSGVREPRAPTLLRACAAECAGTFLLAFFRVIKGIEILQVALASSREQRSGMIALGVCVLIACMIAALGFVLMQDGQARSMSRSMGP